MKATYNDFLFANPNCSNFETNQDARKIFHFLNRDENIIKMAEYADQDKPALAGCVFELEDYFDSLHSQEIDLEDSFTRTVVGRMIKSILEPFGYRVTKQKDLTKNRKGKYFTSASCYAMTGFATMRIVKRVEAIRPDHF